MKKATTKTTAKTTTKTTGKPAAKKTPAKKNAANKTEPAKSAKLDKLNKLELAYAEKHLSMVEYEMWKAVYAKEEVNDYQPEENYRPRKKRRRPW